MRALWPHHMRPPVLEWPLRTCIQRIAFHGPRISLTPNTNKQKPRNKSPTTKPHRRLPKPNVPVATELLPPKLIPRRIAAPPHPLLAARPANAAIPTTTTMTITAADHQQRGQIKATRCARAYEGAAAGAWGLGKVGFGRRKGGRLFGWRMVVAAR